MEEKVEGHALDSKCPRMLNFNAPLLSTRRLGNSPSSSSLQGTSLSTSDRVPFSWEQVPGKPKDSNTSDDFHTGDTPRPKLPPGWWHPPLHHHALHDHDEGCDGDVDDYGGDDVEDDIDDIDYSNEAFSDAIDVFSLSEAIDIVEKKAQKEHEIEDWKLKLAESSHDMMNESPNFIIERFLPDATALVASSALNHVTQISSSNKLSNHSWNYPEPAEACISRSAVTRQSYSSPKGCGLQVFFPWRMKHKLCGVKSPVRHASATASAHPQCSAKHNKHRS